MVFNTVAVYVVMVYKSVWQYVVMVFNTVAVYVVMVYKSVWQYVW